MALAQLSEKFVNVACIPLFLSGGHYCWRYLAVCMLGRFRIKAHAERTRNTPEKTEAKEIKRKEGKVATVKWIRETIMLRSGDDDARLCGKGPSKHDKQHTPTGILFRVCVADRISSHDHVQGLEYSAVPLAKILHLREQCYYILIQSRIKYLLFLDFPLLNTLVHQLGHTFGCLSVDSLLRLLFS